MIPHNRLTFGLEEEEAVCRVVRSGYWAQGEQVSLLETRLAQRAGVEHAVGVGSGLAALRLSLLALGITSGDRVVVPAYSCVALANAVLAVGATPVPVDVRETDWNLDPIRVADLCRQVPVKAAIAVHLFGAPCPISPLTQTGLPVVEDCAHAFGLPGFGNQGDLAVTSLHATKLLGAGEGGGVMTPSQSLADCVRSWRDYTDKPPHPHRLNDKLTDLEAAIALCQLDRLSEFLERRARLAERYVEKLAGNGPFRLPAWSVDRVWYRFVVELDEAQVEQVAARMRQQGVQVAAPVEDWRPPDVPEAPVADRAYRTLVSLPLYPTLTLEEQDRVMKAFVAACNEGGERV